MSKSEEVELISSIAEVVYKIIDLALSGLMVWLTVNHVIAPTVLIAATGAAHLSYWNAILLRLLCRNLVAASAHVNK